MAGATLGEIARRSRVSRATAARILSSDVEYRRPVYARRAKRIRRLAAELGYRPNAAAKAISTGRFSNVGLLMGTFYERSNFTRELLRGIHDALAEEGTHLTLTFLSDEQLADDTCLPKFLREQMVDGLLINYTHGIPPHMREAIAGAALPVVWVNVKRLNDCVYPDDLDAGGRAVRYLVEHGHRRIAFADFVHGPENEFVSHYSALDRREGCAATMRQAGLAPRLLGGRRRLSGPEATRLATAALRDPAPPTACVCQSPRDAALLHLAASGAGIGVPEGLSLITFGGERLNESLLEWTRLVEPREAAGRAAAEMLLERIDHPEQACPARTVAYGLIAGESTAGPPRE